MKVYSIHQKILKVFWFSNVFRRNKSSCSKVFYKADVLKIYVKFTEITCVRVSFLIKLKPETCNFIKKRLCHMYFPVNFAKFLRIPFFLENLWWLLQTESKRSYRGASRTAATSKMERFVIIVNASGSSCRFWGPLNGFTNIYTEAATQRFLREGVLKICSKFTGEYPCRSVISIKLLQNTFS